MKDKEVEKLIELEKKRQKETLMLIPSENYTYPEVRTAVGSILMHKYAEGKPGKRYYQGMENVDALESLCEARALEAFNLSSKKWRANVQPYSGSPANLAVYNALLTPASGKKNGDKIMSMYLYDGGHLSHGWKYKKNKITLVSKIFTTEFYHVDPQTQVFDYKKIEAQASKFKPQMIVSGGTAYPREIAHKRIGQIAKKVGAYYLADVSHEAGLIAAGVNKSPFPYADIVTMTTHKTLRGPRGALIFSKKEYADQIDKSIFPGMQGGPHMHTIAGIATALEKTKTKEFQKYAAQTVANAEYLAQKLSDNGLQIVSGGTDKHLLLIDLRPQNTNGWFVAWALEKAGIIANRNTIPNDTGSPYYPSGLRLGTPGVTVRGMKEKEMDKIASWITDIISYTAQRSLPKDKIERAKYIKKFLKEISEDKGLIKKTRTEVKSLTAKFPIPGIDE